MRGLKATLTLASSATPVTFYASSLLLTAASWLLIWLYATWGYRLIDRHLDSGYLRRMTPGRANFNTARDIPSPIA